MGYLRFRRLPPFAPVFSVSVSTGSSRGVSGMGAVGVTGVSDTKPLFAAASISAERSSSPSVLRSRGFSEVPGRFPRGGT